MSDWSSKLFCVCEFSGKGDLYPGFSYDLAIENAKLIAEVMNKTIQTKGE